MGAFTRSSGGDMLAGEDGPWSVQERGRLRPLYVRDLADSQDDGPKVCPCNIGISYHGYEVREGLCITAMDRIRAGMPLAAAECVDMNECMWRELPDVPPW